MISVLMLGFLVQGMQGASLKAVVNKLAQLVPITRMLQTADTLKYLYMGGRIGRAQHLAGSLLKIKPIISMEDGIIVSLGTARSRKKAYQMMVDKVEAVVGRNGKIKIAYVHAEEYAFGVVRCSTVKHELRRGA